MISRRERLSYAAGDLGFNFVWQSTELYLLFFYVRGLGLAPATASAIFLVGAVTDWICDPLIGAIADRFSRRVVFRAWVGVGGPISGLTLIFAFTRPDVAPSMLVPAVVAAHMLLRIAYSLGNIPYAALTARMTDDPRDHLRLTCARMQGAAAGGLIAGLVYALLPAKGGAGADFRTGAMLLAVLAIPAFLATAFVVRERTPTGAARGSWLSGLADMVRLVRRSSTLRRLLIAILFAGLAVTVVNKSLLFVFAGLDALAIGYAAALVPALALLLSVPVWARLAQRVGRKRTFRIAAIVNALMLLGAAQTGAVWAVLAMMAISIVCGAGMSVMFWALVPAAVEACSEGAGLGDCSARVYALAVTVRKLAQALAPQVVTLSLSYPGSPVLWGAAAAAAVAAGAVAVLMRSAGARKEALGAAPFSG